MARTTRFSQEVRERAVPMVFEQRGECESEWETIRPIAGKIGCSPDTLQHIWMEATGEKPVAVGSQLYEIDRQTGLAFAIGGSYGTPWGLAMMASFEPALIPAAPGHGVATISVLLLACGVCLASRHRHPGHSSRSDALPRGARAESASGAIFAQNRRRAQSE